MGRGARKRTVKSAYLVAKIQVHAFFTDKRFYTFSHLPLPGTERDIFTKGDSLSNVNVT